MLTKPLGIGITTTAIKAGVAPDDLVAAAVASMTASNAAAARAAITAGATGCTDVTGFGLLGHLMKMAAASGVDAVLDVAAVPVLPGVRALAESGILPGGSKRNRDWVAPSVDAAGTARSTCCCWPTPRPRAACCSARSRSGRGRRWRSWPQPGCRRR